MNLVDLTLVIFVALTVFVGIKRGFLISLLSALRFIIAIPLSLFVGNNYNGIIYNKVVRRYILEYVSKKLNDSIEITKFTENVKSFANTFSFFVKDNSTVKSLSNINSNEAAVYITDNILCPIVQEIIKILLILLTFEQLFSAQTDSPRSILPGYGVRVSLMHACIHTLCVLTPVLSSYRKALQYYGIHSQ